MGSDWPLGLPRQRRPPGRGSWGSRCPGPRQVLLPHIRGTLDYGDQEALSGLESQGGGRWASVSLIAQDQGTRRSLMTELMTEHDTH